jgi:hypothetical protein
VALRARPVTDEARLCLADVDLLNNRKPSQVINPWPV